MNRHICRLIIVISRGISNRRSRDNYVPFDVPNQTVGLGSLRAAVVSDV